MKYRNLKIYHLGLLALLISSVSLRFINLGYSEFQDDEKKTQIRLLENETLIDFFMRQRKGPMQFLVAQIPFSIYDPKIEVNETAVRLPFTIANLVSVFVLYALIHKITKSHLASLITSSAYSFNGFVVGFSRIAQYQNLNLLFSLLSLYFLATLKDARRGLKTRSFLAGLFMSLSILSHWDAIFYIIPSVYFFINFILRKNVSRKGKIACFGVISLTIIIFLLPYMFFYIANLVNSQTDNVDYFFKRVGFVGSSLLRHKFIFELYNPVVTLWFYVLGIIISLKFIKRTYIFLAWFAFNMLVLKFFFVTPKTHIYNYVIPALTLASLGVYYLLNLVIERVKLLGIALTIFLLVIYSLLYIQSFQIFVDNSREYPFEDKKVIWYENKALKDEEIITFGFPHRRGWKEINKVIDINCRYITNESKGISQVYVKASYGADDKCLYLVVIKYPFYTKTQNVIYAEAKKSKLVYTYERNGRALSKVYKIK